MILEDLTSRSIHVFDRHSQVRAGPEGGELGDGPGPQIMRGTNFFSLLVYLAQHQPNPAQPNSALTSHCSYLLSLGFFRLVHYSLKGTNIIFALGLMKHWNGPEPSPSNIDPYYNFGENRR